MVVSSLSVVNDKNESPTQGAAISIAQSDLEITVSDKTINYVVPITDGDDEDNRVLGVVTAIPAIYSDLDSRLPSMQGVTRTAQLSSGPSNSAPIGTGLPSDINVTALTPSGVDLSSLFLSDIDGDTLDVSLSVSQGTLAASSGNGVLVFEQTPFSLFLRGTATALNEYLDNIGNILFTSVDEGLVNNGATLTVIVSDRVAPDVNLGTVNIDQREVQSLIVTTSDDVVDMFDGETSLREALQFANSNGDMSIISFATGVGEAFENATQSGVVIRLTNGSSLEITSDVLIDGDFDDDGVADIILSGDVDGDGLAQNDNPDTRFDETLLLQAHNDNGDSRVLSILSGSVSLEGIAITGGNAGDMGGTFPDNTGGGIFVAVGASLMLSTSIVSGNGAELGGGIFSGGALSLSETTIAANVAGASGGGVFSGGSATFISSTLSGNAANQNGAGVANVGTAMLVNTTLSGNSARVNGGGLINEGVVSLSSSTVSGNSAGIRGGGIYSYSGIFASSQTSLTNSIVLGNGAAFGAEVDAFITSNNSITNGDVTDVFEQTTNGADGSTLAGVLSDNGGDVASIMLLAGGLADNTGVNANLPIIDNGANGPQALAFDARGVVRIIDGTVDLGAVELTDDIATVGDDDITGSNISEGITGFNGDDTIAGLGGDDTLNGLAGDDHLFGGRGNDVIFGSTGNDSIDGGIGNDTLAGNNGDDFVSGNLGDDFINGLFGDDTLDGGSGSDTIFGGGQNDIIIGGDGDDFINGHSGFDNINGGAGDDFLRGGSNADFIAGADGNDTLIGDDGHDRLFGGIGNDFINGNDLDDVLFGGAGFDSLNGADGDDILNGDDGNDQLFGGIGNDIINGNDLDDVLFGGAGFDTLNGGAGNDILSGNFNADFFVFDDSFGNDVITDFNQANAFETINLSALTNITSFADLQANHLSSDAMGNALIIDGTNSITLIGIDMNDLIESDFVF